MSVTNEKDTVFLSDLMDKAEKKARVRKSKIEVELDTKVLDANEKLRELEKYADKLGLGVYKKRQRSNIKHVQIIQENLEWAFKNNLLTDAEQHFLFRISSLVEFGSNVICKKADKKYIPCNINDIVEITKKSRSVISPIINSLVDKGFLGYFETGVDRKHPKNENEPHPGRSKIIVVNPRIMHSGYNDQVNQTLQRLFSNSLKKAPIKMF